MSTTTTTNVPTPSAAFEALEVRKREDGSTYYAFREGSPEWTTELARYVHEASSDLLPNDWTYEFLADALEIIVEEYDVYEWEPSVYNADLLAWVSSNLSRMAYVDAALEDYGVTNLADALMQGQRLEFMEVYYATVAWFEEHGEG